MSSHEYARDILPQSRLLDVYQCESLITKIVGVRAEVIINGGSNQREITNIPHSISVMMDWISNGLTNFRIENMWPPRPLTRPCLRLT